MCASAVADGLVQPPHGCHQVAVSQGVFLDLETVDQGDLDRTALRASLDQWQWHDFTDVGDIPARVRLADVVVTNKCRLDGSVMDQAPQLGLIALAATGTNNVDLAAASARGITVCNIRNYASAALAQHVITLMLNLLTAQPWYWQRVRHGEWSRARQFCLNDRTIRQARGLNFGVIGYGDLGRASGDLAASLGMNVLVAERKGHAPRAGRLPFEAVVECADVLSIHCPLSDESCGLIGVDELRSMKGDAILINTARGGIVDEVALAEALRRHQIGGAGIDTLTQEPPPVDHVLLAPDIPNLIVTPHNAWASQTARQVAMDQVARLIEAFKAGQPINRV